MLRNLVKEITPLTQADCFTFFSRNKSAFDFPLHYHEEYELNFIQHAKGAKRIVGDHIEEIGNIELVLVGPNLQHAWFTHHCKSRKIHEITIQFHKDLFNEDFLKRNQLSFIRSMFDKSLRGILFSEETIRRIAPRIQQLDSKHAFDSVLELMSILHDLSTSRNMRILSDASFNNNIGQSFPNSRRIEKAMEYMNMNFNKPIKLGEVAKLVNMSEAAFSRFFKTRTGANFVDCINEIRLGNATRMLIDTTNTVAEIAYECGFNNISNFNRIFKRKKGITPKEFRSNYNNTNGTRIFI